MTPIDIIKVMPFAGVHANVFAGPLTEAMAAHDINTPKRQSAFIAQVAHESVALNYMREIASGADYDTGAKAISLGNTPAADGDGQKYKGRGPIQITGLANYTACGKALGLDLINHPELLEEPEHGCAASAWYWQTNGLNELADTDQFGAITKRINGGYTGLDDRLMYWLRARKVFGL